MDLKGIFYQDCFLALGAMADHFFPAVGAEFSLDNFVLDHLKTLDTESIRDGHPCCVSVELQFRAEIVRAEGADRGLSCLDLPLKFSTADEFIDGNSKPSCDICNHFQGRFLEPLGLKVGEVGLFNTEGDEIPLREIIFLTK